MKDGAMGLQKVTVTGRTLQLPPWAATGMAIGAPVAKSQPASVITAFMRAEMHGGVDTRGRRLVAAWVQVVSEEAAWDGRHRLHTQHSEDVG